MSISCHAAMESAKALEPFEYDWLFQAGGKPNIEQTRTELAGAREMARIQSKHGL